MSEDRNHLGQPIGRLVENWQERMPPPRSAMQGRWCRVEPLDPMHHADALYAAYSEDTAGGNWTYLPYGPFSTRKEFLTFIKTRCMGGDPFFHAIIDLKTDAAVGVASYLRMEPSIGVIEVGHIHYSPLLQRTPAATEAMYLMMNRVFQELKFRRYEWKCDALNARSRKAAERLGFQFEGVFRQARITNGRNRDTAWYSILDKEWPAQKRAFETWLKPDNFDSSETPRHSLSHCRLSDCRE